MRWLVLLDVLLLVPGKLSLDPCPWKSLDVHAGIVSSLLCSVTAGEGGPGAVPFFGVSQFLYPVSCWRWFWSQGTTSGAGQSFVDRLCGFFGHAIPSETWQASGLFVQASSYVGNSCPLVLIKYPGMKATIFCCVYLPSPSLKQWRCSLAGTWRWTLLSLLPCVHRMLVSWHPWCAQDARELLPMCAQDARELAPMCARDARALASMACRGYLRAGSYVCTGCPWADFLVCTGWLWTMLEPGFTHG